MKALTQRQVSSMLNAELKTAILDFEHILQFEACGSTYRAIERSLARMRAELAFRQPVSPTLADNSAYERDMMKRGIL